MRALLFATVLIAFSAAAYADDSKPAGTAKGAAIGAVAGHEVGSGHAMAGAAVGAAVGHHQSKKAEQQKPQG